VEKHHELFKDDYLGFDKHSGLEHRWMRAFTPGDSLAIDGAAAGTGGT
jgi:hypothetical protein